VAGWAIAWSRSGGALDSARWKRTIEAATRFGGTIEASETREGAIAAWRREGGEFPASGRLIRGSHADPSGGGTIGAFVGQVLDDEGDATASAIEVLSRPRVDDAAIARLNGPFAYACLSSRGRARIVLDRYRHYRVFVHHGARWSVAATDIGCIVPWLDRREIDLEALAVFVRSGEMIDRGTLLSGVDMLPPAAVVEDDGAGPRERRYWKLVHREDDRGSFEEMSQRLADLMRQGVRRIERANPRLGVTLSGGLDSRLILGVCERRREIPAFTWGLPGCRDIACAAAFARMIGAPHTIRHWEPEVFPGLWGAGADLTSGAFGIESMHMLPYVGLLSRNADVILNGLAGDVLAGGNFLKLSWLREKDCTALAEFSWRWRVSEGVDGWCDRLLGARGAGARSRWVGSIVAHDSGSDRPIARLNDWLYPNRVFRYTNAGTLLLRWGVESHAPFFDRDFVDALLGARLEWKLKHRLYLRMMEIACPEAARAPWQRTMIPPAWGLWANTGSMALQRIVRAGAKRMGINAFPHENVADVPGWLRGAWAKDAERILFDGRLLDRGLVEGEGLRAAWGAHMGGENLTRPLAALIAVELWARRWIDGERPAQEVPA
jgi:asparagine synthetase B (glutamine-hydrolysing)